MKTRAQKEQLLVQYVEKVKKSKAMVFADYSGVKSEKLFQLKDQLSEKGIDCRVVKNRILNIAFLKEKLELPEEWLDKPLCVAFSLDDGLEAAKIVYNFCKENDQMEIVGGLAESAFIDSEKVKILALLPGRDELYARLVGAVNAPRAKFVWALKYNQIALVNILKNKLTQS